MRCRSCWLVITTFAGVCWPATTDPAMALTQRSAVNDRRFIRGTKPQEAQRHKNFCASCASCGFVPLSSRHVRRRFDIECAVTDNQFGSLVVVLTDKLEAFAGGKPKVEPALPRC